MRKGKMVISVVATEPEAKAPEPPQRRFYTGLQVTKDPGVWIVYSGFVLMILGCFVTFFMSHQQICIEVKEEGGGSRVALSGTASRNRLAMDTRIERMAEHLEKTLGAAPPDPGEAN